MKTTIVLALVLTTSAFGQVRTALPPSPPAVDFNSSRPGDTPTSSDGKEYRVGHDDLIDVSVFDIPELSSTGRVSAAGTVVLPYIGAIDAAGKTPQELAHSIEETLKGKYVNDPHVTVFVREYASQPVSVIGAVKVPNIYQIKGEKRLLDVLAMAQGLNESAGKTIQIIRRFGENETDSTLPMTLTGLSVPARRKGDTTTIIIDATDLFQNGNATLNIPIYAGDVVNVLNAGSIFTVGEFQRPGEYTLRYGRDVTVTQAIALGGGLTKDSKRSSAVIIRPHRDGTKEQIPINIAKVLAGSEIDPQLIPNDVLFVPSNKVKTGLTKALDSAVAIVIGRAIYTGF